MRFAILWYRRSRAGRLSSRPAMMASVAMRTWQMVHSGFFPPQRLTRFRQEQIADRSQNQMSLQADPSAPLPMIEADLALAVFKASLDRPPSKCDPQQFADRGLRRSITQEVFDFTRHRMVEDKQVVGPFGQSPFVLHVNQRLLDAPDQWAFFRILDPPCLPRLSGQRRMRLRQSFDRLRLRCAGHEARKRRLGISPLAVRRSRRHPRRLDPGHETLGNFAHELLAASGKRPQKLRLAAIPFVKRQPRKADSLRHGASVQFQRNLRLRAIRDVVGNSGATAAFAILTPAFREKQIRIDQAAKAARRITQVDGDNAVLPFSNGSAPLPLDAGSLLAFFGPARLVNDADRIHVGMLQRHDFSDAAAHLIFVPRQMGQKLLQRPHGSAGRQRHRFDALPRQFRKLAAHVNGEMRSRITPREAVIKAFQVIRQLRLQATNLFGIHALASGRELDRPNLRRYSCGRQDQLSAVVLRGTSEIDLRPLEAFPKLDSLWLELKSESNVRNVVKQIARLRQLEELQLDSPSLTGDDLAPLRGLEILADLVLRGGDFKDSTLVHLQDLPRLGLLDIGGAKFTDVGLNQLNENLEFINFCDLSISDAELACFRRLPKLRHLRLGECAFTDAGLTSLAGMDRLKFFEAKSSHVTNAGVETARQSMPNCSFFVR